MGSPPSHAQWGLVLSLTQSHDPLTAAETNPATHTRIQSSLSWGPFVLLPHEDKALSHVGTQPSYTHGKLPLTHMQGLNPLPSGD